MTITVDSPLTSHTHIRSSITNGRSSIGPFVGFIWIGNVQSWSTRDSNTVVCEAVHSSLVFHQGDANQLWGSNSNICEINATPNNAISVI